MSSRMLQRALRNNSNNNKAKASPPPADDTLSLDADRSSDAEEAEEDRGTVSNPFDLLGQQDEREDDRRSGSNPFDLLGLEDEAIDENEDEDVGRDSNQRSAAGSASTSAPATTAGPSISKRKKNKGKKKGKKDLNSGKRPVVLDEDNDEQSVDKLLERLVVEDGERSGGSPSQNGKLHPQNAKEQPPNVLAVNTRHLRAEDELRRIFGSKVVNSVERSGEGGGAQRRRQGGGRRSGMPLRKSLLVVPMEHWPRWDGGISMDCIKVEGGIQYFRYQYSVSYQDVQNRFESCVASHDPNTIVMLLRSHPYHVDSLLALAEVYKQMGEHQQSAHLVEQCLYALECAWHPWFNPSLGTCRVEFSWDTNKALFLSLFRHMQHLGRRGCHRTALELCKLLLSLDPSDPLGALFCIDYFALRAEQYEWLERFVDEYETDKTTLLLPNFSFSVAVACFHLERQPSEQRNGTSSDVEGAKGAVGNQTSSVHHLQQALMLHPSVLRKIIVKAPIKEDTAWAKIITHPHFSQSSAGGPTLEHLVDIYVERSYLIWRSPELQGWLKENAAAVTQIADKISNSKSGSELANWNCIREELFRSDENEYKHLHLSEFSDSTSTLPPEEMPQLGFQPRGGEVGGGGAFDIGDLHQAVEQAASLQGRRNALLAFLQSLIPWTDFGGEASVEDTPALLEDDSDHDN